MSEEKIIRIVGKERYVDLLKKYNLCTKKWTYARCKGFNREIKKILIEYFKGDK